MIKTCLSIALWSEKYVNARLLIYKIAFEFETTMKNNFPQIDTSATTNFVKHSEVLNNYFKRFPAFLEKSKMLNAIRNKFSHSEYPLDFDIRTTIDLADISDILRKDNHHKSISWQLLNILYSTYQGFMIELNLDKT